MPGPEASLLSGRKAIAKGKERGVDVFLTEEVKLRAGAFYPIPAIFLARSFLASRLAWRRIMMRWAWGGPAPCMDSVR